MMEMMSKLRRICIGFDLDRADYATREVVKGIVRFAEKMGSWHCVFEPLAPRQKPSPCDGLIAHGRVFLSDHARKAGIPYVAATAGAMSRSEMTHVVEHRTEAGSVAARHLMARGYSHFAYLGRDRFAASRLLEEGFRWGLRERGQVANILLLRAPNRKAPLRLVRARAGISRWLDGLPKPVGIFACSDILARYLADACLEKGLRVPDDVGLVGAGNDPAICLAPPLALSSVDFAYEKVGYRAAARLEEQLQAASGKPQASDPGNLEPVTEHRSSPSLPPADCQLPTSNTYIPPGLVARASTDRAFGMDVLVADAVAYIAQNCHRALAAAEIARELGVGQRRLLRRFRAVRDRTIRQEIALVRLGRARDLLATTGFSAEAIARAVGLGSGRTLRRMLRRGERTTPSTYRAERARRPRLDVYPMEQAKGLLERTDYPLALIYMLCGFRSRWTFNRAFRQQEGMTPGEYRALRAAKRPVPKPPEITITLDLDDEEESRGGTS